MANVVQFEIFVIYFTAIRAYKIYQTEIPNGEAVPHPCKPNYIWRGVGHENTLGSGARNQFGKDFAATGHKWTKELCDKDSDDDGLSNGQELGDPDCVWKVGDVPKTSMRLSHPGVCNPFSSAKCISKNAWVDCSLGEFNCSALHEPGMKNVTIRFPETKVPDKETNYYCMIFELPQDGDYHMVANMPVVDNAQVMHHIIMSGCDETQAEIPSDLLNKPKPCDMLGHPQCHAAIGGWTVGVSGLCAHPDVGIRIGKYGFRKAVYQIHWNNPESKSGYTDSSGLTLFYTESRRVNDAIALLVGQNYFEIPPGKEQFHVEGACSSDCTALQLKGPVYVAEALNHMHYMGRAMQIEHYRNGNRLHYITNDPAYSYDSPSFVQFDKPIEILPGDEIKTKCTYSSVGKVKTTFKGDSTSDEMCFAFLSVYPRQNIYPSPDCSAWKSLPKCKTDFFSKQFPEINKCRWQEFMNSSHTTTQKLHQDVHSRCQAFGSCLTECKDFIKNLKEQHPCMSGDIYDFVRMRSKENSKMARFFAAADSCNAVIQADKCHYDSGDSGDTNNGYLVKCPIAVLLLGVITVVYLS